MAALVVRMMYLLMKPLRVANDGDTDSQNIDISHGQRLHWLVGS
jgi:hypothetical protein